MFVGEDQHGARGAVGRSGMTPDRYTNSFVATARPLATQLYPDRAIAPEHQRGGEYPKMLYGPGYYEAQQAWKNTVVSAATAMADVQRRDQALHQMRQLSTIVQTPDEEQELLMDGWRENPVDHLVESDETFKDPRVPVGSEARRSREQQRIELQERAVTLQRELALTISKLNARTPVEESLAQIAEATELASVEASIEAAEAAPIPKHRKKTD